MKKKFATKLFVILTVVALLGTAILPFFVR